MVEAADSQRRRNNESINLDVNSEMIGFSFFLLCYNIKYVNVNVKCFLSSIATDSVLGMEGDLL